MVLVRSAFLGLLCWGALAVPLDARELPRWQIPTVVHRLDNGLTLVVSPDATTPAFGIAVVYGVGFRLEPRGRTGFAHLFEHLMYQGTAQIPKGTFGRLVESSGGVYNASTRRDYTAYYASLPTSALERMLWLEADRMRGLDVTSASLANQRDVVKEEIRVNVRNAPYGLFYWIDLPALAFERWENTHDGYGSFVDLDAATLEDVRAFHRTYYAPNNAVIAIAGDVEPERVFALARKLFGDIPAQTLPPPPDLTEPLGTEERWREQTDPYAKVPGLAVGWRLPAPGSADYDAAMVLSEILLGGEASRLFRGLVREQGLAESIAGGVDWGLDTALRLNGPALLTVFARYRPTTDARALVAAIDREVAVLVKDGVGAEELARTRAQLLAGFWAELEPLQDRAKLLALRQLFTGDAATLNAVPERLLRVGSEDLRRVAASHLAAANRVVIDRRPQPPETAKEAP